MEEWVNSQNYIGEDRTLCNYSIASIISELTHSSPEASSYIISLKFMTTTHDMAYSVKLTRRTLNENMNDY